MDLSERSLHGALLDARLLADVYLELMGGRQVSLLEEKQDNKEAQHAKAQTVQFPRRHFAASVEELEAHQAFLAKYVLKKA
ncbi:MAG: hypothetical protein ACKO96_28940 [Flammeovirgaceae bacterium]